MTVRNSMRFLCCIFLLCLVQQTTAEKQEYYRWTDEQGITHYDLTAPKNTYVEKIEIHTTKSETSKNSTEFKPDSPQKEVAEDPQLAEMKKQRKGQCEKERKRLARLETNGRMRTQEDGYRRYLTRDEISERKEKVRKFIREACESGN